MSYFKYGILLSTVVAVFSSWAPGVFSVKSIAPSAQSAANPPKNIILIIGDGMGLSQITAGMYRNNNQTPLQEFPVTGLIATQASNRLVTDSGAGATAFACGCKTYNGAIGVNAKRKPCRTLLEIADSLGMATGIVVNCSVTHATPASFVAHEESRKMNEEIALWYLKNQVDFIVGGGGKFFEKRTIDQRDLLTEMKTAGYQIVQNRYDSIPAKPALNRPFFWVTANEEPPAATQGRAYLPQATSMATDYLTQQSANKGFFLMVEGSQIDWGGHSNDGERLLAEMRDFEKTLSAAMDFARKDGQTLVVVTADHETGGMSIVQGSTLDSLEMKFMTKGHTATMVPVFAYGPGSELFGGLYQNTGVFDRILGCL